MSSSTHYNVLETIQLTLIHGTHELSFKNGAFVNLIPRDTPAIEILDILVASSLLTAAEKVPINSCKEMCVMFRKNIPQGIPRDDPDFMNILLKGYGVVEKVEDVFKKDARARGLYTPPTTIQMRKTDGSIAKTVSIHDDGTIVEKNGGIPIIPSGAPDEFAKANEAMAKAFGGSGGKKEGARAGMLQISYADISPELAKPILV